MLSPQSSIYNMEAQTATTNAGEAETGADAPPSGTVGLSEGLQWETEVMEAAVRTQGHLGRRGSRKGRNSHVLGPHPGPGPRLGARV